MMPFCTATPNSAMKPTPLATLRFWPVRCSEIRPPERRQRHHAQDQQRLAERVGADGQEDQHHAHDQPQDHQQPRFGAPLILELAAPLQADLVRIEMHLRGDLRLRFLEIGGQIAIAIVDADGEIALAVLARHGALARCARGCRRAADSGTCAPLAVLTGQIAERLGRVARVLREAHRQRIGSLADVDRRDRRLADAGLDDVLHVGHVDAVARGLLVIELDLDLRDRRLLEDRGAGGAVDRIEHVDDLIADAAQLIQIIAVDLDHQRAVRAADQVVDAVDDGLADADRISGQILGEVRRQAGRRTASWIRPPGQVS